MTITITRTTAIDSGHQLEHAGHCQHSLLRSGTTAIEPYGESLLKST